MIEGFICDHRLGENAHIVTRDILDILSELNKKVIDHDFSIDSCYIKLNFYTKRLADLEHPPDKQPESEPELKPCPFCGSDKIIWECADGTGQHQHICSSCAASTGWFRLYLESSIAWNRRHDPS